MTAFLTAADAILLTPFTGGALLVLIYAAAYVAKRDRRDAAREDARAASLTYWRDTNPDLADVAEQAWEDHPAKRADIARTRREQAGRRDMERIVKDALGGGAA